MAAKKKPRSPGRHHRRGASPRTPFLDACLIVKNEEVNLPGCLESLQGLRPLLASVNVYDTGSTDDTAQIARDAGCVVVEGYWDDDFARARNEALALSRAEWAIVIDADERIVADAERLVATLRQLGRANVVDAELYHLDEHGDRWGHTRYIKAVKPREIRFAQPVHEVVASRGRHEVEIVSLPPEVVHFSHLGYASPEVRRGKATRNLRLADAAVARARAGGDAVLLAHALRQRARSWTGPGSAEKAIQDYREAWPSSPVGSGSWVSNGLAIASTQMNTGDLAGVASTLTTLKDAGTPERLWLGLHAEMLLRQRHLDAARTAVDDLLSMPEMDQESDWVNGPYLDRREVLDLRLRIALEAQEHAVAVAVCLLLIGQGEVDRVPTLCTLWMRSSAALAAALAPTVQGPHGEALLRGLRACPGLGEDVAERLGGVVAQPNAPGADEDEDVPSSTKGLAP